MGSFAWGSKETQFFYEITPDKVLDAVESSGLRCTGLCSALNSMENRVYEVELETPEGEYQASRSERFRVAKFYRPGRWTKDQILEEHQFLKDLREQEIPVIAPIPFGDGETLHQDENSKIWYALFPKVGGRAPDELEGEKLERVARLLARIHNVGSAKPGSHRIQLDTKSYGEQSLSYLKSENKIPLDLESRFVQASEEIFRISQPWFEQAEVQRVHGDCHFGNLLWNDDGPFFLDFDDMVRGPCIQDIWLVVPGRDDESKQKLDQFLRAYEQMRSFDQRTIKLIEPLRALRFIHFAAWISKRWEDPAFPQNFPQYGTHRYWTELTSDLEEQVRLIQNASQI